MLKKLTNKELIEEYHHRLTVFADRYNELISKMDEEQKKKDLGKYWSYALELLNYIQDNADLISLYPWCSELKEVIERFNILKARYQEILRLDDNVQS